MIVLCINGAINTGKTTVGRLIGARVPGACFVDGDDHERRGASLDIVIEAGVDRLVAAIGEHAGRARVLVLAYPLREPDYARLREAAGEVGAEIRCVTLAPSMEVALSRRGERQLSKTERARVAEMYAEGYAGREFSGLVLDNSDLSVEETVEMVRAWLAVLG